MVRPNPADIGTVAAPSTFAPLPDSVTWTDAAFKRLSVVPAVGVTGRLNVELAVEPVKTTFDPEPRAETMVCVPPLVAID
jgi:hypothetical protein